MLPRPRTVAEESAPQSPWTETLRDEKALPSSMSPTKSLSPDLAFSPYKTETTNKEVDLAPAKSPTKQKPQVEPLVPERAANAAASSDGPCWAKSLSRDQRKSAFVDLNARIVMCEKCPALVANRSRTVFGVGSVQPEVVFFGEAPGADEDAQGEPFVGRAGQLLTKIIEACGWKREDVYIMNVLKCRPPDNRAPTDVETENCRPFFEEQLAVLRPKYIVCVGASPTKALLKTKKSIGQLRGQFFSFEQAKVLVTYHPAYLLRNPDAKKLVWDDMKFLLGDMGLPIPSRPSG